MSVDHEPTWWDASLGDDLEAESALAGPPPGAEDRVLAGVLGAVALAAPVAAAASVASAGISASASSATVSSVASAAASASAVVAPSAVGASAASGGAALGLGGLIKGLALATVLGAGGALTVQQLSERPAVEAPAQVVMAAQGEPLVRRARGPKTEPAAVEPAAVEPAAVEPAVVEPAVVEPAVVEPAVVEPAVEPSKPVPNRARPRARRRPAPPVMVAKARPVVAAPVPMQRPAPAAEPAPVPVVAAHVEPAPRVHDSALSAEHQLISAARVALRAGDAAGALKQLAAHERAFARGRLAPERAWLRVEVFSRMGRSQAARQAAQAFARQYPNSLYAARVAALLERLPAE
jgi:hypothetical protein